MIFQKKKIPSEAWTHPPTSIVIRIFGIVVPCTAYNRGIGERSGSIHDVSGRRRSIGMTAKRERYIYEG